MARGAPLATWRRFRWESLRASQGAEGISSCRIDSHISSGSPGAGGAQNRGQEWYKDGRLEGGGVVFQGERGASQGDFGGSLRSGGDAGSVRWSSLPVDVKRQSSELFERGVGDGKWPHSALHLPPLNGTNRP